MTQTPVSRHTLSEVYGINKETCIEAFFENGASVYKNLYAEIKESRESLRQKFGWGDKECIFLFVGTLLHFEGIETMLNAAALVQKSCKISHNLFGAGCIPGEGAFNCAISKAG